MALPELRSAWRIPASAASASALVFAFAAAGVAGVAATPAHAATTMNLAYVADSPSDLRVVDMATSTIVSSIPLPSNPSLVVASPDKHTAYAVHNDGGQYNDSISVIDVSTSTVTHTAGVCHDPGTATMKPNSTELWVACFSGGISVFDTASQTVTRTITTGVGDLNGLSFTADGSTVYSTFRSTSSHPTDPVAGIVAVNTATSAAIRIADADAYAGPLLSPDGSTILVANWRTDSLALVDTASGAVSSSSISLGGQPDAGALNPAGTAAYYCVDGTRIVVVDLTSKSIVRTLPVICGERFTYGSSLAFADQNTLYAVAPDYGVSVIDVPTGTVTATLPRGSTLMQPEGAAAFVQASALAPTVAAISPAQGPEAGANTVVITGGPFIGGSGGIHVSFGGVPATAFSVDSETRITAVVPAQTFGTVDVTVTGDNGTSAVGPADHYTYVLPPPAISSMAPNGGVSSGGTPVVITGTDFSTTKAVYFGGTAASSFTVDSDTQITAMTRAQTNGTVTVTVTNAAGVSTSTRQFTYFSPVPLVTAVSPAAGSSLGGTTVTITGMRFKGTFRVILGGVAVPYTLDSDSQITIVTPPWSSVMTPAAGTVGPSGSIALVDVQVTTDVDTSATSPADLYDYVESAENGR